jgi:hypothetical protein
MVGVLCLGTARIRHGHADSCGALTMARDPIPVGYTTLPEAVARLVAKLPDGDKANSSPCPEPYSQPRKEELSAWNKRERAIVELRKALQEDKLIGIVRDATSGIIFRIPGADWWQASYWREIILGGRIRAPESDRIACHAGQDVMIETTLFDEWLEHRTARETRADKKHCLDWLVGKMRESPDRTDKPKPEWLSEIKDKFGLSRRAAEHTWASALQMTGAKWGKAGRKKLAR